jgi:hypothetical protein
LDKEAQWSVQGTVFAYTDPLELSREGFVARPSRDSSS